VTVAASPAQAPIIGFGDPVFNADPVGRYESELRKHANDINDSG
jgi:hypothetical protein